jgi:hypothetical protein
MQKAKSNSSMQSCITYEAAIASNGDPEATAAFTHEANADYCIYGSYGEETVNLL